MEISFPFVQIVAYGGKKIPWNSGEKEIRNGDVKAFGKWFHMKKNYFWVKWAKRRV